LVEGRRRHKATRKVLLVLEVTEFVFAPDVEPVTAAEPSSIDTQVADVVEPYGIKTGTVPDAAELRRGPSGSMGVRVEPHPGSRFRYRFRVSTSTSSSHLDRWTV
jgi:hypothetical protein